MKSIFSAFLLLLLFIACNPDVQSLQTEIEVLNKVVEEQRFIAEQNAAMAQEQTVIAQMNAEEARNQQIRAEEVILKLEEQLKNCK